MDAITQTVATWQSEALIIIALLAIVVAGYYLSKIRTTAESISVTTILGLSLACITVFYLFLHPRLSLGIAERNRLFFLLLYGWSALGLWFFAGKNVGRGKFAVGLALQAGIIYGLFRYV
jgi:steroid 5-alpha reductase family enzyme